MIKQDKYLFKRGDYMKSALKTSLILSFTIGFCFILFNNLGFAGDNGIIQQKEHFALENPESSDKHRKESLSNLSPLKENRQKYSYRYYPSCSVYYCINRKLYFYPKDGSWKIFAFLPRNLERQLGDYVKIEMDSDKPYLEYDKHVKEYPPEDSRKKKNNMWSKLILFLFYNRASK